MSRACRALREMPRSPRLAHKEPVMKARVGSLLSKRALLLGLALYGFGTQKLHDQSRDIWLYLLTLALFLCYAFGANDVKLVCHKQPASLQSLFFLSPSRILYSVWWRCYPGSKTLLLIWELINRVVINYFVGNWLEHQGHPTTVFCKIRVRKSIYCLEFFLLEVWHQTSDIRQLKSDVWQQTPADIRWPFFMYNFQSFSNKSATTFWSLIFHILLPMQVRLFFAVKRKSKIFGKVILEP